MNTTPKRVRVMTSQPVFTRRSFLVSILMGMFAGELGMSQAMFADTTRARQKPPVWLQRITGDRNAVVRFGQAYLNSHPREQHNEILTAAIDQAVASQLKNGSAALVNPTHMVAALKRTVRGEYARGDVVSVEGWILSVTEVRVYALLTLLTDH